VQKTYKVTKKISHLQIFFEKNKFTEKKEKNRLHIKSKYAEKSPFSRIKCPIGIFRQGPVILMPDFCRNYAGTPWILPGNSSVVTPFKNRVISGLFAGDYCVVSGILNHIFRRISDRLSIYL